MVGAGTRVRGPAKINQLRFVRVRGESELREPLRKDGHDTTSIGFQFEHDHEVIRIAHQASLPTQSRFGHVFEPLVQHVVEIHVGSQGGYDTALGAARFGKANVSVFHNAGVEPFADQSKEYTVTHSLAEKRL